MEGLTAIFMSLLIPIVAIAFGCWTVINKKNRDKDIRRLLIENDIDIERAKLLIDDVEKKGNKYSYLRTGLIAVGMGLGGPTGFAMNQARDLGPRLAYTLLPIQNKTDNDWQYGLLVPGIAPFVGAVCAALFAKGFLGM